MVAPPAFYPILDVDVIARRGLDFLEVAGRLFSAKVGWVQFRHKCPFTRQAYELAAETRRLAREAGTQFVMNDRADIALMVDADGVHLGQDDLPPAEVRKLVGDRLFIGYSTHNEVQLRAAGAEPVDYLALGPLFRTSSKDNADPVVGVPEWTRLRPLSSKPLVAIGGATRANARQAFAAGADSVAVISDFLAGDWSRSIAEWAALRP